MFLLLLYYLQTLQRMHQTEDHLTPVVGYALCNTHCYTSVSQEVLTERFFRFYIHLVW